jgi:hypothetical protein
LKGLDELGGSRGEERFFITKNNHFSVQNTAFFRGVQLFA